MGASDVAIVGAGLVGASLAAELASRGMAVAVYERAAIAAGASGRNAGAIWRPTDPVLAVLYEETLARYRALPALLDEHAPGHAFRLDDDPAGLLALGTDGPAIRALAASEAAAHPELAPAYIGPDELRRLEPGVTPGLAAVRYDICYPVAPAAATTATAALARGLGARFHVGVDVRSIATIGGFAIGVVTADGLQPAGAVVIAAGPWTPALVDPTGRWVPIRPAWGVVVELELPAPPRHVLEEVGAEVAPGADESAASGFSLVTAEGRSALGWTYLPDEPDPGAWEAELRRRGAASFPAIAEAPSTGHRACARPVSHDGRPLAGLVPGFQGLFVAAGHGPWGLSTGPATAAHVAALVADEPERRTAEVLAATAADRFGAPPV